MFKRSLFIQKEIQGKFQVDIDTSKTPSRKPQITFQTPGTLQTHSKNFPDTIQTLPRPSKQLPGTFCYISIPLKDDVPKSQVTRRVVGWLVVYWYIIMPLCSPTCKMVLTRIQFILNSKLDPRVAIMEQR